MPVYNTFLTYNYCIHAHAGVEKNNDDAKRNYFSSNLHDPAGEVLKAFDSVPHRPLMQKLFSLNLNPFPVSMDFQLSHQPDTASCGG